MMLYFLVKPLPIQVLLVPLAFLFLASTNLLRLTFLVLLVPTWSDGWLRPIAILISIIFQQRNAC
ncbi:hypothetical protein HanXRQr2_Chr06g0275061 [Helianthus annuus]|uniref:Uncharacterized protein n=1 Tax=Helianthus annuus TaxID=4232 RepID=A0A9K3IVV8_HELAN|nr:hypothetical protein HanXRQr2_Chr06g0275061 [Helianthus annuus]KAJ0916788.1 hypothetical protein HanPSC8_Chr06g0265891 [Helianthus annuus]